MSRWLRWLVVSPVVFFVLGALLQSCSGGSSSGVTQATVTPGFSLQQITISDGPPASPTIVATGTPKHTATPTLTPRPASTSQSVPSSVPTGGSVQFNALGLFVKGHKNQQSKLEDITVSPSTLWTSSNQTVLIPPVAASQGGNYSTGLAGCACIAASSSGVISQLVGLGVYVDVGTCPLCPQAPAASIVSGSAHSSVSEAVTVSQNSGVLMWTYDVGADLRGRIAVAGNGSLYFVATDGVLHGLDSNGKEIMHRFAGGVAPVVMADGTVIAMSPESKLAAIGADGAVKWELTIGAGDGPIAASDDAIYASASGEVVSVSAAGSFNWRVNAGPVVAAAATADGMVIAAPNGALTSIAADGAIGWTFMPAGGFSGAISSVDDTVYAGSGAGLVYAIDARTGKELWHLGGSHAVVAGPAVGESGTIFFASDAVYSVSADGQMLWAQPAAKPGSSTLTAVGYDSVFDAGADELGAMLAGDGNFVWSSRNFGKIVAAASSPSGMLYVANQSGRIFAVK